MSEKIIKRVLRIALGGLLLVSVVLGIVFVVNIAGSSDREVLRSATEPVLIWTYILLGIAAASAVLFPIAYIIQNPRKAVKALISLVILVVVVLIAYAIADGTPIETATSATNPDFANTNILKITGTGLWTTYILVGAAILLLLVTGVRNMINNR